MEEINLHLAIGLLSKVFVALISQYLSNLIHQPKISVWLKIAFKIRLIAGCIITTCTGCSRSAGRVVIVQAAPEKGYNYPYILKIPGGKIPTKYRFLLVEPNNTGHISDDFNTHLEAAKALSERAIGSFVARELRLPLLVPVFPRPKTEWEIYTHLLDRDVMTLREGPMQRLDLQLISMVEDARERLSQEGQSVDHKILITGFRQWMLSKKTTRSL